MKTKVTVYDVARYILNNTKKITTMKLQKLVYYAQAWSLVWDDAPLFNEKIEAWANGPVVKSLYNAHKGSYYITAKSLESGDVTKLSKDNIDTINVVLKTYGELPSYQLIELTHSEKPWKKARGTTPIGKACSNEILLTDMAEFYSSLNVAQ